MQRLGFFWIQRCTLTVSPETLKILRRELGRYFAKKRDVLQEDGGHFWADSALSDSFSLSKITFGQSDAFFCINRRGWDTVLTVPQSLKDQLKE